MKTRFISFLMCLALSFSIIANFAPTTARAQDSKQTIADIVVASTKASKPEFTTLLAAVQAADPAFLKALSDPKGNFTVFAPTDAAFGDLLKALNVKAEDLLKNKALLNVVLAYHVIPARFEAKTIAGENDAIIGTLLPDHALTVKVSGSSVMVDKSTVTKTDILAANGVVHIIDKVLVPEDVNDLVKAMTADSSMDSSMSATTEATMSETEASMGSSATIADVVVTSTKASKPEFTTLLAAVQAADPAVLATLSSSSPLTVFAPTDAAFTAALKALNTTADKLLADKATLTKILLYHVAPGSLSSKALLKYLGKASSLKVVTLAGVPLTVTVKESSVMIDKATVATADVAASNGIVHIIDAVLLPPTK